MSIFDSGIMRLMSERMSYLGQRQAVLGQNVANANTPNYKAKDLEDFTFENAMKSAQGGMKITNDKHILPASMAGVNAGTDRMHSYETVPSGNSVDLEQQMMEVSKTAMDYQTTVSLYHKMQSLWRTAVGK